MCSAANNRRAIKAPATISLRTTGGAAETAANLVVLWFSRRRLGWKEVIYIHCVCIQTPQSCTRGESAANFWGGNANSGLLDKQKHAQYSCRGFCLKLFECARCGGASSLFASSFFVQAIGIFKVGSSRSPTSYYAQKVCQAKAEA